MASACRISLPTGCSRRAPQSACLSEWLRPKPIVRVTGRLAGPAPGPSVSARPTATSSTSNHDDQRITMGGGAQYPYPKHVWSPAGGWWVRPHNWASNTAFAAVGIAGITYAVWNLSAEKETRPVLPHRWIPSMLWAKQFKEKKDLSS